MESVGISPDCFVAALLAMTTFVIASEAKQSSRLIVVPGAAGVAETNPEPSRRVGHEVMAL
jgi:hypothetical protein